MANDQHTLEGTSAQTGPLSDVRVIELGQLVAGPFCGQLLGDMGADVIKVEPPETGDPMRAWGHGDYPLWWSVIARNKRCITANLRVREGQDLVRHLIAEADILIENFRPGTLERWGLGYDVLQPLNPRLIMVRISGYGQSGPYAHRPGYASVGEAMGGMRALCGEPDRPPSRAGLSLGDTLAATFACNGALAALHHRAQTGAGQVIDMALYEAVLNVMEATIPEYTISGHIRQRTGATLPGVAPSNIYPCQDSNLIIAANQDTVFQRLAEAMADPGLANDPRFQDHASRGTHQGELDARIAEWTATQPVKAVAATLEAHGVPHGEIYEAPDMLADPHFSARDAITAVADQKWGLLHMQNIFPKLSATPGAVRWSGPPLGAHNREVYGSLLGLDEVALEALRTKGVI